MRGHSGDRRRAKADGRGPRGTPVKAKAKTQQGKSKVKTRDGVRAVKPALARPTAARAGVGAVSGANLVAATDGRGAGRQGAAAADRLTGSDRARPRGQLDSSGARGGSSSAVGSVGHAAGVTAPATKTREGRDRFRGVVPGPEAARPEAPPLPTPIASFTL